MDLFFRQFFSIILLFGTLAEAKNYLSHPEVGLFIHKLATNNGLDPIALQNLFADVEYQQTALSFYNEDIKPLPEKCRTTRRGTVCPSNAPWDRYSHNLLSLQSVQKGKEYLLRHRKSLDRAYKQYGIPPEYITAIIGIESFYGANTGQYPVFDTLTTLAFETNRRSEFFRSELEHFLILAHKQKIDPKAPKGSYAGAMGLGQFMPSNFKSLAVDFDRDGTINLDKSDDAIGSIAHYLRQSGWLKGTEVAIPAIFLGTRFLNKKVGYQFPYKRNELKETRPKRPMMRYQGEIYLVKLERAISDELWYGTQNFYAITRYNHSDYYAMAVFQLAEMIANRSVKQSSGTIIVNGNRLDGIINNNEVVANDNKLAGENLESFLDAPVGQQKIIIELD
jgi:membrane-bound lytic murein transglycosylase B